MGPANNTADLRPIDRLLRLFAPVRSGEGTEALLLSLNVFLILTAYYVLKPIREALILAEGSAELKSYISAAQVVALIPIVRLYSGLADRYARRRLINVVTWFFIACLPVFFLLGRAGVPLGVVFFFWIGIFNVMIVAQFWSFANDLYTDEQGERLFPIVAFGASAGAVFGASLVGQLIEPLGLYLPMVLGAGLLAVELQITNRIDGRRAASATLLSAAQTERDESASAEEPPSASTGDARGGFTLILRHKYLLMIAFLILFLNWVNTTGEYILGKVVETNAEAAVAAGQAGGLSVGEFIGSFYADFFAVVNAAGLLIQLFLVSRIVKYVGIRLAVMILPIISLGAYGLIAFYPVLGLVRWAKTGENATDYSLNNTVRHALFLVTSREEKYKAKQAIDSFFWRMGDVLSALLVFVGTTWLAWSASGFARFNVVLVIAWLTLAFFIGREYKQRTAEKLAAVPGAPAAEGAAEAPA